MFVSVVCSNTHSLQQSRGNLSSFRSRNNKHCRERDRHQQQQQKEKDACPERFVKQLWQGQGQVSKPTSCLMSRVLSGEKFLSEQGRGGGEGLDSGEPCVSAGLFFSPLGALQRGLTLSDPFALPWSCLCCCFVKIDHHVM